MLMKKTFEELEYLVNQEINVKSRFNEKCGRSLNFIFTKITFQIWTALFMMHSIMKMCYGFDFLKRVPSKPSEKLIVAPIFFVFELETSNFSTIKKK